MEFSEGIFHHILVSGGGNIPSKLIQAIKNVYKLKLEQKIWKKSSRNRKEKKNIEHPVSNMISFRDTTKKRKIPRVTEIKKCKAGEKSTTNNYVNLRNYFWQACAPKFFISSSSTKSCKTIYYFQEGERTRALPLETKTKTCWHLMECIWNFSMPCSLFVSFSGWYLPVCWFSMAQWFIWLMCVRWWSTSLPGF